MKFFSNKFLISFLILTVAFYSFSVKTSEAEAVVNVVNDALGGILDPLIEIVNLVINLPLAVLEVMTGNIFGIDFLSNDGNCRLNNLSSDVLHTYDDECDNGGGGGGAPGSPTLNSQTATPIKSNESCITGFTLLYSVTDAYQYGIYRDGNLINQGTLNTVVQPSPYNTSFSYIDDNLTSNTNYKYLLILTDKNGKQYNYPEMTSFTECSPYIVFNGPDIIEYPNPIILSWIAENVTSLIASGDWSGSKEMGAYPYKTESLSKPRGTYIFILSGTGFGGSDSKQVTTQVIQVPYCSFSAGPTSIILPQASTLSWSCSYADVCSIDNGIGSVSNTSGSEEVRPSETTTYTLTCDGLDGTREWQATVNVGFTPKLKEIAP